MIIVSAAFKAIITFPGVIMHQIAYRFFADLCKVPVYEVRYFQAEDPCGFVIHAPINKLSHAYLITLGPFFVNTI